MTPNLHLPNLLREVRDALGLEIALALAANFGGLEVKIPKAPSATHPIATRISPALLEWLVARSGGERLAIPLGPRHPDKLRAAERADQVRRLTAQGWSCAEIARHLVMHERSVRLIRERTRGPDLQMDLFRAS